MKKFKTIDYWISIVLIISFAAAAIIDARPGVLNNTLLTGYFITGGWQVISMLTHAWNRCFTVKWGARHIYHWITFISLVTIPVGSFWILFITAPFMAVYYTYLCYHEVTVKMQRPLAILK